MQITIRQLQVFEAVARQLSYTRAAEELHLTQPAVSMQVKQLENSIGLPLFEQIGKRVFMTQAGEEAVVTVLAKSTAKLGLIFLDVKRAAKDLEKLI